MPACPTCGAAYTTAARIGWQTESNWTDPLLFTIYSVAKPLASVLILLFMLQVISGGNAQPEYRAFVVVGSALWSFVIGGVAGLAGRCSTTASAIGCSSTST